MDKLYQIKGTKHLNPSDLYSSPDIYPKFQENLEIFQHQLIEDSKSLRNNTYYKFGDGDYYLFKNIQIGTAKPGMRDLYKYNFLNPTRDYILKNAKKNDYLSTLLEFFPQFKEIFNKEPNYLAEYVYGLIANKWFFNNFKKIGLIGSLQKIQLIKELINYQEYKDYLGIDSFESYHSIPQKYALPKSKYLYKKLGKSINKSKAEIFLIGIGLSQNILLNKLKNFTNKPLVIVGVGIDAIAGCVNINRPYFGNWINYRIKNNLIYEEIDDIAMKTTINSENTYLLK